MADLAVPHFHNEAGVAIAHVGSRKFMCIGALPPFDHPHVFMDMGSDTEIVCPYCATLYRFRDDLAGTASHPPGPSRKVQSCDQAMGWSVLRSS